MRQFPIFVQTTQRTIIVVGGGDAALAKLRLLCKTEAKLVIFAEDAAPMIAQQARAGKWTWNRRMPQACDMLGALMVYAATEDVAIDATVAAMARAAGVWVNIVDDLSSDFFSAAIVDRDPVTIAIGTEGTAPVLARQIKSYNETVLPTAVGEIAKIAEDFRLHVRDWSSVRRRDFWGDFWGDGHISNGLAMQAWQKHGKHGVQVLLHDLKQQHNPGAQQEKELRLHSVSSVIHVIPVQTTEPDLLTVRDHAHLDQADIVVFDADVPWAIREIARREATHHALDFLTCLDLGTLQQEALRGARLVLLQSGKAVHTAQWQEVYAALQIQQQQQQQQQLDISAKQISSPHFHAVYALQAQAALNAITRSATVLHQPCIE